MVKHKEDPIYITIYAITEYDKDYVILLHDDMNIIGKIRSEYEDVHELHEVESDLPRDWINDYLESIHEQLGSMEEKLIYDDKEQYIPCYAMMDYPSIKTIVDQFMKETNESYAKLQLI